MVVQGKSVSEFGNLRQAIESVGNEFTFISFDQPKPDASRILHRADGSLAIKKYA